MQVTELGVHVLHTCVPELVMTSKNTKYILKIEVLLIWGSLTQKMKQWEKLFQESILQNFVFCSNYPVLTVAAH